MLDKVLVLFSQLVDEGGNKYPTDSAAFERSLPGMKGVEKLQLGKEKIWCPERSFLILCGIRKQIYSFWGLGPVDSIPISAVQMTCFSPPLCPLLEKIARQIGINSECLTKLQHPIKDYFLPEL